MISFRLLKETMVNPCILSLCMFSLAGLIDLSVQYNVFPCCGGRLSKTIKQTFYIKKHKRFLTDRRDACLAKYSKYDRDLDIDFIDSMNDICTKVIKTCSDCDEERAVDLKNELHEISEYLKVEEDFATVFFIDQVIKILDHETPIGVDELVGPYKQAWNRIESSIMGTLWTVGRESDGDQNEHRESPNVRDNLQKDSKGNSSDFYGVLGVANDATAAQIKSSFRSLAMKFHPDVNDEEDAHEKFIEISRAYEVLSDKDLKMRYDMFGDIGERSTSSSSNSDEVWKEVEAWVRQNRKPKKPSRREQARELIKNSKREEKWNGWEGVPERLRSGVAQFGDVVKYPLPQVVKDDLKDGREFGIGVVVGRNIDRADVSKIPASMLEICEVEPLEYIDGRWKADTIGVSAYPTLLELEVAEVIKHERGDVGEVGGWYTLKVDLSKYSPQCYHEEIIL